MMDFESYDEMIKAIWRSSSFGSSHRPRSRSWTRSPSTRTARSTSNVAVSCTGKALLQIPIKFGKVTGSFSCNENDLQGPHHHQRGLFNVPHWVGGNFGCRWCWLYSLEGAPTYVGGNFNCDYNYRLEIAKGIPAHIGGQLNHAGVGHGFERSLATERLLL